MNRKNTTFKFSKIRFLEKLQLWSFCDYKPGFLLATRKDDAGYDNLFVLSLEQITTIDELINTNITGAVDIHDSYIYNLFDMDYMRVFYYQFDDSEINLYENGVFYYFRGYLNKHWPKRLFCWYARIFCNFWLLFYCAFKYAWKHKWYN